MKILFYIENLGAGGKERRLVELIKGLKKHPDIEMELVLTRKEIHYSEIFDTRIKIHYTIRKRLKKDPRLFWKFYKIAKQFQPDVIHVWGSMTAFYSILTKILLRIPLINNQIADINERNSILNKLTFSFSDIIVANSQAGLKSYGVSKRKNSIVIYNGFDFNRLNGLIDSDIIKRKFNVNTKIIVGMFATFYRKKDYKTYIEAAIQILKNNIDITFLCVGAGDATEYKMMVPPLYKSRVLFLGRQENVESIMNICDIGVLSTFTEGIPNVVMEFMALSKPVIVTNGGGTSELVVDNKTGFLIPKMSPNVLAEKLQELISNEDLRLLFGKEGRLRLEKNFNIKKMIDKYKSIYNQYEKY